MADDKIYYAPDDEFFLLWILIAQNKDVILKAREREFAHFGVGSERRAILFIIYDCGGKSTPTQIAQRLFREVHSVSEMLVRMENDGLVAREKIAGQNKVEVTLTDKGLDVFKQSLHGQTDKRILSVLNEEERKSLASMLLRVRQRALEELGTMEWQLDFPAESQFDVLEGKIAK